MLYWWEIKQWRLLTVKIINGLQNSAVSLFAVPDAARGNRISTTARGRRISTAARGIRIASTAVICWAVLRKSWRGGAYNKEINSLKLWENNELNTCPPNSKLDFYTKLLAYLDSIMSLHPMLCSRPWHFQVCTFLWYMQIYLGIENWPTV